VPRALDLAPRGLEERSALLRREDVDQRQARFVTRGDALRDAVGRLRMLEVERLDSRASRGERAHDGSTDDARRTRDDHAAPLEGHRMFRPPSTRRIAPLTERHPDLVLAEQDPAAAEEEWERILRRLEEAGLAVEPVEPGCVYFETGHVERMAGGIGAVLRRALDAVGPHWQPRIGVAGRRFAALAAAFGAHGETVERTADFSPAFERALGSGRPALVELRVDPEAITPRATLSELRAAAESAG